MFKKQNFAAYTLPVLLCIISIIISIFSNEIKQIIETMNIGNFLSVTCIVGAGVSISYSYYLRLKDKVIAIKKFRDLESVRMANHYNAIIKGYQSAFEDIQAKCKIWGDKKTAKSPIDEKNEAEDMKHQIKEILEYNESFKDWGIGNYGVSPMEQTFYQKKDYSK